MYRLTVITLALLIGCQQEMPPSATALSDEELAQIEREVTEVFDALMESSASSEINIGNTLFAERKDGFFLDGLNFMTMSELAARNSEEDSTDAENDSTNSVLRQEFNGQETRVVVLTPAVALVMVTIPEGKVHFANGSVSEFKAAST